MVPWPGRAEVAPERGGGAQQRGKQRLDPQDGPDDVDRDDALDFSRADRQEAVVLFHNPKL